MVESPIHKVGDGRNARLVYINGNLVRGVLWADAERGIVQAAVMPLRLHKGRLVQRTLHGQVTVFEAK